MRDLKVTLNAIEKADSILNNTIQHIVEKTATFKYSESGARIALKYELKLKRFPFKNKTIMNELIPLARTYRNLFEEESKKVSDTQVLFQRSTKLYEYAIALMESGGK